ncbi:mediator of RNA polymerase II transcription subunit 12-like protein isoform X2 [Orbicella faveolata]|uniref:mediator of RNA polymerase II transcription subunit 12-like protein isoform X2 n=1 Tax=Orbicella faveolata TaxID=48498 RepID=UPI0009E4C5BA|nr:mediator of RNA polymerase II transcription subunit 12-like protein isoform X2 [Orbicella faveolata]
MSQTLARSLAQVCSKKLTTLYSAAEQMQSEQQSQGTNSSTRTSSSSIPSPVPAITSESSSLAAISPQSLPVLSQYKTCPQHHALVLALSSVLQTIAICCPGALIWNSNPCGGSSSSTASSGNNSSGANADAGTSKPAVLGSPLDRLPIAPSAMPLPSPGNAQGSSNSELLSVLLASEEEIKTRSKAIESHWSPDKYQDKSSGETHFTDCSTKIKISMVNQFGIKSYPANIFAIKIF